MSKPKPDDRSDNVERIQRNINYTIRNMEAAEDMLAKVDDPTQRREIEEKNDRRRDALQGMREEIRDEALDKRER